MSYAPLNPFVTNLVPLFNVSSSPAGPTSTPNYSSQIAGFQSMINYNTNTLSADNINGLTGTVVNFNSDLLLTGALTVNGYNVGPDVYGNTVTSCSNFAVTTTNTSMILGNATPLQPGIRFYTNNIEVFYIDYQGHAFFSGQITSQGTNTYSDERLKSNITPLINSMSTLSQLNAVQYTLKNTSSIGFIAQEVNKVLPNIVNTSNINWSIDYIQIIPFLVESIKELNIKINHMQQKIETMSSL